MRRSRPGFTQILFRRYEKFQDWKFAVDHAPSRAMKILTIIVRILLGLAFVVFGLNFFLNFIPAPPPPPGLAGDYFKVFVASGYHHVVGAMQLLSGLMLLIGLFVPLGLVILGAILFNICTFHILMQPAGLGPAIVATLLWAFLVWSYRERFAGVFRP
jgi:putative oxidoreductase